MGYFMLKFHTCFEKNAVEIIFGYGLLTLVMKLIFHEKLGKQFIQNLMTFIVDPNSMGNLG